MYIEDSQSDLDSLGRDKTPGSDRFGSSVNIMNPHIASMTSASTSTLADQNVAPFLAKHIPEQYAPLGQLKLDEPRDKSNANSKYCYRHRPDLKCRRQADEPSMDQLQRVSVISQPLHRLRGPFSLWGN
jgi:F-box/WD-40 domain protein MET30